MRDKLIGAAMQWTVMFWLSMGFFIIGMGGTLALWMFTLSWLGIIIAGIASLQFAVVTVLKTNADNALRDFVKSRTRTDVSRWSMEDVVHKAESLPD